MLTNILALGVLSLGSATRPVSTLSGHFSWVQGTLASAVTISTSPVTISLKVGTVTDTFADTYITGVPGTSLASGTPMIFLEKGSEPFEGTYTTSLNAVIFNQDDGTAANVRRTVPMSNPGTLSYSVASVNYSYGSSETFYLPAVQAGGIDFVNGLSFNVSTPIASYALAMPSGTSTSFSNVDFPAGSLAMNQVSFSGLGNGQVTFNGLGSSTTVDVAGTETGAVTTLTDVTFSISSDN